MKRIDGISYLVMFNILHPSRAKHTSFGFLPLGRDAGMFL